MPNAVEKLFNSVLNNVSPASDLDWPDMPKDSVNINQIDEPVDSERDKLVTLDQEQVAAAAADRIAGGRVSQELDSDTFETFEGGIRHRGLEALAFYKSRRFVHSRPFPGHWGIFYLKQGLTYVESLISDYYPAYGNPKQLALNFLRQHERFHYQADIQTLLFEATLGKQLYVPVHKALMGSRSYFTEEALANRHVWDWARKGAFGIEEFAKSFMLLQPNAYSRFLEPRLDLAAEWAGTIVNQMPPGAAFRPDLSHWVETSPRNLLRASLCPEYVIYPSEIDHWVSPAYKLPSVKSITESESVLKLLRGRMAHLKTKWEDTKTKLVENHLQNGLDLKPWPEDGPGRYSVRVDRKFRAHLHHTGSGQWLAYVFGPHKKLGHG